MAKKKRKSIYDKPLKDINKDGKVNFGDTWLGDALGFDGELGIQKGRPGLKESLKGARRGKKEPKRETKKEDKPKRPRIRPSRITDSGMDDKAAATRKSEGPMSEREPLQRGPSKRRGARRPDEPKTTTKEPSKTKTEAKNRSGTERAIVESNERQSNARARAIQKSAAERKSPSREEFRQQFYRSPTGLKLIGQGVMGVELQEKADEAFKKKYGMAKGGMARHEKKGNRSYKGKGMFYDSKSPRGYK